MNDNFNTMVNKQIYIHYGTTVFDSRINFPIQNKKYRNKPVGGLWASRVDAEFGWKQWNKLEEYSECNPENSFLFVLKDESRLFTIRSFNDIFVLDNLSPNDDISLILSFPDYKNDSVCIDFEALLKIGIDAIELDWYRHNHEYIDDYRNLYYALYGWDCDSIVVLNPDAVIPIRVGVDMDSNPEAIRIAQESFYVMK